VSRLDTLATTIPTVRFERQSTGKKAIQALERNEKEENTVPRQHT
jgi:hypothetical protein